MGADTKDQPEARTAASVMLKVDTTHRAVHPHDNLRIGRSGARRAHPVRGSVAVCIVGQMRTFLERDVQASFLRLHHPGYEYFISTDSPRPSTTMLLLAPIRAWSVDTTPQEEDETKRTVGRPSEKHKGCPPHTCNHRSLLPMVLRMVQCYTSMEDTEAAHGLQYR